PWIFSIFCRRTAAEPRRISRRLSGGGGEDLGAIVEPDAGRGQIVEDAVLHFADQAQLPPRQRREQPVGELDEWRSRAEQGEALLDDLPPDRFPHRQDRQAGYDGTGLPDSIGPQRLDETGRIAEDHG